MKNSLRVALLLAAVLFVATTAWANGIEGGPLEGFWLADVKCEGLLGPLEATPGPAIKFEVKGLHLLIAQGNASAVELIGEEAARQTLDVVLLEPDVPLEAIAGWCGWSNPSNVEATKGQGSLGPFAATTPVSLSFLFDVDPPAPFVANEFEFGDSTMHIKKWELGKPDGAGCDAKLEMAGSTWVGEGGPMIRGGGGVAFATCTFKAKRCPSEVEIPRFCWSWEPYAFPN